MPERPYRQWELHQHLIRQYASRAPDLVRALRLHPDWTVCPSCRWPIDPAAGTTHPACSSDHDDDGSPR